MRASQALEKRHLRGLADHRTIFCARIRRRFNFACRLHTTLPATCRCKPPPAACVNSRGTHAARSLTACPATWHTCTLQGGSQLLPMDCLTLRSTTLCSRARDSASAPLTLWRRSLNVGAHPTTSAAAWCAQPTHRADGARHPIRFPGARAHLHHAAARLLADRAVAPTAVRASLTVCPLSVCEQSAPSSRCEHILEHPSAHGARPAGCAPLWATARAVRPARARSRPSTPHPRPSPHRLAEGVSRARALPAARRLVLHAAGVGA